AWSGMVGLQVAGPGIIGPRSATRWGDGCRAADRNGNAAVHRHRGLDPAAALARRRLRHGDGPRRLADRPGPGGRARRGRVVSAGTPADLAASSDSLTARHLRTYLE